MLNWHSLIIWVPASLLLWAAILFGLAKAVHADHLMCAAGKPPWTQTVSIDPAITNGVTRSDVLAAMDTWNGPFVYDYGIPIFREHTGPWWTADIIVTSSGERTWVQGPCNGSPYFDILWLGSADTWRNRAWLVHELGHTIGLADHVQASTPLQGYVNPKVCGVTWPEYHGIMSYCASPDLGVLRPDDHKMVREYWNGRDGTFLAR